MIRRTGSYRADAFAAGLERLGYAMTKHYERHPNPDDLLLLWNRSRGFEAVAQTYERAGATVLITENGYIGQPAGGGKWYALARGKHNGAGRWHIGDQPRFDIPMQPWRNGGDHVLVLPQRGIGSPGVAMPHDWVRQVTARLHQVTTRPIRVRKHPGAAKSDPTPDLVGAHCAVTWGSGAAIKAIFAGVPAFHDMPDWIGAPAALRLSGNIETCYRGPRDELLRRISWAQFSLAEIESGEAFRWVLQS